MIRFIKTLGPGILFAAAAIGVSHLVQATRAGADYGYGLLWAAILIHLVKYPFFEIGVSYALATGEDLVQGYKRLGKWVLGVYAFVTVGTMFTVQAAVTVVTASLAVSLFGIFDDVVLWSVLLLGICAAILAIGRYSLMDNLMKVIVLTLTISTTIAVVWILVKKPDASPALTFDIPLEGAGLAFLIALMGWMPAPLDLSVWHSMWAGEKQKLAGETFDLKRALLDFRIGYVTSLFTAILFVMLGALVMFGTGETFAAAGGVFAGQLIEMYTTALGGWAKWLIAVAAFTTMFSTMLTCLDAQPRAMARVVTMFKTEKRHVQSDSYWTWLSVLILGTVVIFLYLMTSMGQMVKIATILSFLTTPFFAVANYLLINRTTTPIAVHQTRAMRVWSWFGIIFLIGFAGLYLVSL